MNPRRLLPVLLFLPVLAGGGLLSACSGQAQEGEDARQVWAQWQVKRLAAFQHSPGWLNYTASGRLPPGDYLLGGELAEAADIRLPVAEGALGRLLLDGEQARFEPLQGGVQVPIEPAFFQIHPGTRMAVGDGQLHLVRTGPLWGWRFQQPGAAMQHPFKGFPLYPYNDAWRLRAHWERYEQPEQVTVLTNIGTPLQLPMAGRVHFDIGQASYSLPAYVVPEQDRLMVLFTDRSNGRDTPPAGRMLLAPLPPPEQRWVELDFNRAEAMACAVTAHVVCPLPPAAARLPVVVDAGEKAWVAD